MLQEEIILSMVDQIRQRMPRIGGRKLHHLLNKELAGALSIGRDALFGLLRTHGYLLRYQKKAPRTTYSYHHFHKYANLIEGFIPFSAHQLYVSDITYLRMENGQFLYLSLITDAYSHKIVGWAIHETLETEQGPLKALEMALEALPEHHNLIHHSDRGIQYCSHKYINLLRKHHIRISMTQSGDPRENAIAERVNGILKMEWINDIPLLTKQQAQGKLKEIIHIYNHERPHGSIQMLQPAMAHQMKGPLRRMWKNYYSPKYRKEVAMNIP